MLDKQSIALQSIYNAATDSEGWNASLDACVDYVGAYSANVLFHDNNRDSPWRYTLGSERWRGCTEAQMAKAIELFERYDSKAWAFVHKHRKQTLLIDTDYWTDSDQLGRREDYQFCREELGFVRKAGSKLNDNKCWTDNIAFQFAADLKTIPGNSLEKIRHLLPHAAKSIEMWRTFSILKGQYQAVLAALDHVKVGLCIAEPGGSIIVANEEARRILDIDNGIKLGADKLIHCRKPEQELSIQNAMASACATSAGQNSLAESFEIIGSKQKRQISVEISPLRDAAGEIANHFNGALITLIDLSAELDIDINKIAAACKLSPSEREVCKMIIQGATVSEIAETRSVSEDTVKSQLKSSYRKTGCRSRVQLTRMALKADPPVRGKHNAANLHKS